MRLETRTASHVPSLAWSAELRDGAVSVVRGEAVEEAPAWVVEGIWDGLFGDGGFDRTEAVFGSGVRVRDDRATFVSAGTLVDRLWCYRGDAGTWVGNCLPVVLACVGDHLSAEVDYSPVNENLPTGTGPVSGFLPTGRGEIAPVYFNNLEYTGTELRVIRKPSSVQGFPDFESYHGYLVSVSERMGENASSGRRSVPVELVSTISRGYDSPAAAVMARHAGATQAVSIRRARSVVPRSDSGREIADRLGLSCVEVDRRGRECEHEVAFWAADGSGEDRHMARLPYDEDRVTALFTGAFGDGIWRKEAAYHRSVVPWKPLPTLLGICEYRLIEGIVHCPVPYLGRRCGFDILRISHAPEMGDWSVSGEYDRPIPRRIVEEAGGDREMFGQKKAATSFVDSFRWPASPDLRNSYRSYLAEAGGSPPPVGIFRLLDWTDRTVLRPLEERAPLGFEGVRRTLWQPGRGLFSWANNLMTERLSREGEPTG